MDSWRDRQRFIGLPWPLFLTIQLAVVTVSFGICLLNTLACRTPKYIYTFCSKH